MSSISIFDRLISNSKIFIMKKTTLTLLLIILGFTLNAQNSNLNSLLDRLHALSNSPISEKMVINNNFTIEEQIILNDYFANQHQDISDDISAVNRTVTEFVALDVRNGDNFGTFGPTPPFNTFNTINVLGTSCFADDTDQNGDLFALDFDNLQLIQVDQTGGTYTAIGAITGLVGSAPTPSGLAYNYSDGIWYALSTDGTITQLYSIDITTGALTPIGTGTGNLLGIWLEIDTAGNAYMADIGDDLLYSVDLTSGLATPIGPLGVDISFAQDVTIDHEDDTIYMSAYTGGGTGGIHAVDTATGTATLVGSTTALNAEFGMFSVNNQPLSVQDNLLSQISIYPNPASDLINLKIPSSIEVNNIVLYDVLGKNTGVDLINGQINITGLSRGVYVLNINTSAGTLTKKVIKQ